MIQSTDDIPINFGFFAKANTVPVRSNDQTSSLEFPKDLEDQLIAGACGYAWRIIVVSV